MLKFLKENKYESELVKWYQKTIKKTLIDSQT